MVVQSQFHPSDEDQADFVEKVLPIVEQLAPVHGLEVSGKLLNLAMGAQPKTKKERAFQAQVLKQVSDKYEGSAYPKMCARLDPEQTATRH